MCRLLWKHQNLPVCVTVTLARTNMLIKCYCCHKLRDRRSSSLCLFRMCVLQCLPQIKHTMTRHKGNSLSVSPNSFAINHIWLTTKLSVMLSLCSGIFKPEPAVNLQPLLLTGITMFITLTLLTWPLNTSQELQFIKWWTHPRWYQNVSHTSNPCPPFPFLNF